MKSFLPSFTFSNGLETRLLSHLMKNLVISNGRIWFVYFKWRLVTQHIRKFLPVWPGPFPVCFWAGPGKRLVRKHATGSWVWGHAPRKCFEFRDHEIGSETISGPKSCFSAARQQTSSCINIYFSCPLRHAALVLSSQSFANLVGLTGLWRWGL